LKGASHGSRSLTALYAFSALFLGLFFLTLSALDVIPWWVSGILSTIWFFAVWGFKSRFATRLLKKLRGNGDAKYVRFSQNPSKSLKLINRNTFCSALCSLARKVTRQVLVQLSLMVLFCTLWFWLCWAVSSACVTFYPISISTRVSRPASSDVCLQRDPCHVYLTVGSDLANEVILHVHSSHRYGNLSIALSTVSQPAATCTLRTSTAFNLGLVYSRSPCFLAASSSYPISVATQEYQVTRLETTRVVYYAALSNLSADTTYYFRIVDAQPLSGFLPIFTREYSFVSGPQSGPTSSPFSFVTGGDMGVSALTNQLTAVAAAQNPLFVAIGGDMSYDNGIAACYRRWDAWFDMLASNLLSTSGRLTPYLVAPGNHEGGNFYQTDASVFSFYRPYFVREPLNGRQPTAMPSYSSHKVGNLMMLSLDSNVYTDASAQTSWIEQMMSTTPQRWLTAIYHAPLWPSVRSVSDPVSTSLRQFWGPLFERFGLDVAFENHDHAYKRTKPMLASGPSTTGAGTLHVGDGKWGLDDGLRIPQLREYNAFVSQNAFVLHVQVNNTAISARALDSTNAAFDSFTTTGFEP
jgi:hypothetical protein